MIERRSEPWRGLVFAAIASFALVASSSALADDCANLVSLDRAARLSVDDLGRVMAMGDRLVEHRFVRVDTFRPDARPVRGGRTALAIAGAGGEAGEASFVGVLWTARPELFAADAVVIVPAAAGAARIEARASGACGLIWRLELSTDGVVRVNGARAARLAP